MIWLVFLYFAIGLLIATLSAWSYLAREGQDPLDGSGIFAYVVILIGWPVTVLIAMIRAVATIGRKT